MCLTWGQSRVTAFTRGLAANAVVRVGPSEFPDTKLVSGGLKHCFSGHGILGSFCPWALRRSLHVLWPRARAVTRSSAARQAPQAPPRPHVLSLVPATAPQSPSFLPLAHDGSSRPNPPPAPAPPAPLAPLRASDQAAAPQLHAPACQGHHRPSNPALLRPSLPPRLLTSSPGSHIRGLSRKSGAPSDTVLFQSTHTAKVRAANRGVRALTSVH